jgi:hypothetical protein
MDGEAEVGGEGAGINSIETSFDNKDNSFNSNNNSDEDGAKL